MVNDKRKGNAAEKAGDKELNGGRRVSATSIPGDDTDHGSIRISESVFAALVRKYTLEVDGVVRFASGSLVGGLAEMIGRRSSESSIVVKFDGGAVNIAVTLVIRFGAKIPEVSELVQSVIRNRIEEFTGNHVNKVDVIIQGIEEAEPEEETNQQNEVAHVDKN